LAEHTKKQHDLKTSHSIDELDRKFEEPSPRRKKRRPPQSKQKPVVIKKKPEVGNV
jgi:hypothetical protein